MEKFSIRGPGIRGRFYTDNDIHQIHRILCSIKENIDFASRRPNHERTPEFLKRAFDKCIIILDILDTDKPTRDEGSIQ